MCGRRKYGKARLLVGDRNRTIDDEENEEKLPDWGEFEPEEDENEAADDSNEFVSFGFDNPDWQWVLGLWQSPKHCRFVRVPNRTTKTPNAVISRYVEAVSHAVTDMWGGYNELSELGYQHKTVNHSENNVDPQSGAHTREIEVAWNQLKVPDKRMGCVQKH